MIPILYDKNETAFVSNGLGRLQDTISCVVTEERNGLYECDFEYPVGGAHYDQIQVGRIIGVTHDETGDVQPFDIVSYSRPIDGIVSFHAVHISYRQSYITVTGSNIQSLADAFTLFGSGVPSNPFSYSTDKTNIGFLACADGIPRSVREMLGGIEGSVLDAYGGEYEWNKWQVILHSARGQLRSFSIRYGVNMTDYTDETNIEGSYSSCVPYWTDGENKVIGDRQVSGNATLTGRGECVPLDVSDKFESQPSKADVESAGVSYMNANNTFRPSQTLHVEFVRIQDAENLAYKNLLQCSLCDTINVYFPDYNASGQYKIVKTEWDVLQGKYQSMELGDLSVSLAEALGISNTLDKSGSASPPAPTYADVVVDEGTANSWRFRKWENGTAECWRDYTASMAINTSAAAYGGYRSGQLSIPTFPSGLFNAAPLVFAQMGTGSQGAWVNNVQAQSATGGYFYLSAGASIAAGNRTVHFHAIGTWK